MLGTGHVWAFYNQGFANNVSLEKLSLFNKEGGKSWKKRK
jgi:hypothetical protein